MLRGSSVASLLFLGVAFTTWAQRDYILREDNGRVILVPKTRLQKKAENQAASRLAEVSRPINDQRQIREFRSPLPITSGGATPAPLPQRTPANPNESYPREQSEFGVGHPRRPTQTLQPADPGALEIGRQETGRLTSPDATIDGVSVEIIAPKVDEVLRTNEALVFLKVSGYPISPTAFRVKAILDNESPRTLDNIRKPIIFNNLSQGGHLLRVYLVKPNGRVVDDPGAFAMRRFYVGQKDFRHQIDALAPLLTVNDPVAGRIELSPAGLFWFDFLTRNAPIGEGAYGIRYRFNNVSATVYSPKPIFWRGLREGRYQFTAELIDPEGNVAAGPFNRVEREFEIVINQQAGGVAVQNDHQKLQLQNLQPTSPSTSDADPPLDIDIPSP
ncbi:MAG: hypothetical protein NZM04_07575 [Methylacidiphilales bacterium]|nr:hypothetical protein [Candidatus Methylacidiphilales bacterium]MDW8349617.1 hypothetical protein [Verrucomicrobiae bacterium]